ncbi:MAG TPA: PEP-CTERM sorting domain-containing protein [Terriglobales bacterium]|nr:PEP-CTERM sorting domain-containing protein [Terriglobales bacterium]
MRKFLVLLFVFACYLQMYAAPVKFTFSGTVRYTMFSPDNPFETAIQNGTQLTGNFIFDSQSPDTFPYPDPNTGTYVSSGGPYGMMVNIGGMMLAIPTVAIYVENDSNGHDWYSASAEAGNQADQQDYLLLELYLDNDGGTVFKDDSLPLMPPALSYFESGLSTHGFAIIGQQTKNGVFYQFEIDAHLDHFGIPEPASFVIFGGGLLVFAVRVRRIVH